MMSNLFVEIAFVVAVAGGLSLIAHSLRQPLIIAYIATGVLVAPILWGLDQETLSALAKFGVALLLFIVGLHLNWRGTKNAGKVALLTGVGQVLFTSGIGYLVGVALGFDRITAFILGLAFAFSSTIIIVKLLSDKGDIERFYGRIVVGVLIVQDVFAMVALLVISALPAGLSLERLLVASLLKGLVVLGVIFLLTKFALPRIFAYAARSQELLLLIALGWCFAIASSLYLAGFSIEIGALIAGVSLASSRFQREIESKVRPLRDFFLVIFFVVLGTQLSFGSLSTLWLPALVYALFILIGNPLVVIVMMRLARYHPRTGFLVGVTMAQVSEFSFIVVSAAFAAGLVASGTIALVTVVGLITIAVSTYLIDYNEYIYDRVAFLFSWMEVGHDTNHRRRASVPQAVVFGYEGMVSAVLPALQKMIKDVVVVDFDPVKLEVMRAAGVSAEYGDAGNEDFLRYLHLDKTKIVISSIADSAVTMDIVSFLRRHRSRCPVIVTAKNVTQAKQLYDAGATFVVLPGYLSGSLLADILEKRGARRAAWAVVARGARKAMGF